MTSTSRVLRGRSFGIPFSVLKGIPVEGEMLMEDQAGQLAVPQRKGVQYVTNSRPPTADDNKNQIPTFWVDKVNNKLYALVDVTNGAATWGTLV